MLFSEFPEFNIDDLTKLDNNNFGGNTFDFDRFSLDPSNVAGPSQPYMGVDVRGDLDSYPEFPTPDTAPTSLYPTHGVFPDEGKSCFTTVFQRLTRSRFDDRIQLPILPGRDRALLSTTTGGPSFPVTLPRFLTFPDPFARL